MSNYPAFWRKLVDVDGTKKILDKWLPDFSSTNVGSATKLANARTIRTNLASEDAVSFDGTANITPGVTNTLPIAHGGTGNTTGTATYCETTADTSSTIYAVGVTSGATTQLRRDTSITMAGGALTATGAVKGSTFQATSDSREKKIIGKVHVDFSPLSAYKYTWKDIVKRDGSVHVGLIAQEVAEVLPEAISIDDNDILHLDYNAVVAALVAKVNELEKRIERLER